jgi:hypothetical protein
MKRAERPLYPLRRTKDEDVPPQTTHLPSSAGPPPRSIDFVSVISRIAWHLTQ